MSLKDCSAAELADELKRIQVVRTVDFENVSGTLFDRYLFPVMIMDDMRAVVVSAGTLLGIENHYSKFLGQRGKQLLFDGGKQAGLSSLRNMRKLTQKTSARDLLANIEEQLRTMGWGIFKFDTSAIEKGSIEVTVRQPVFSEVDDAQESWYTFGLAAGLMEGLFGTSMVVATSAYKPDAKELTFKLQEQVANSKPLKSLR